MSAGFRAVAGAMVLLSALAMPAHSQGPSQAKTAESVRAALADYGRRLNAGDFPGALAYYADDPRFFWVDREKVVARSKAEIVRGFEQLKGTAFQIEYRDPSVTVLSPDLALLTAGFSAKMGTGAKEARFAGLLTLVLIRSASGWRFLSGRA